METKSLQTQVSVERGVFESDGVRLLSDVLCAYCSHLITVSDTVSHRAILESEIILEIRTSPARPVFNGGSREC